MVNGFPMRIGELARRTGLSRDAIRFYERRGLLRSMPSAARTNDYRDYPEEAVERVAMIAQAQAAGFTIADLEELFESLEGRRGAFDADAYFERKIRETETQIARARRFLRMLRRAKAALRRRP
jgi:DNA-binding transcriptional MerR regulator